MTTTPLKTSWHPSLPIFPTLGERAAEAAELVVTTLFPDIYPVDERESWADAIPPIYAKVARIIIEAIDEGLV